MGGWWEGSVWLVEREVLGWWGGTEEDVAGGKGWTLSMPASFYPLQKPAVLNVFIAWLSLDFGIESCFYSGMNAYAKTWLQLVFHSLSLLQYYLQ